MRRYYFDLGFNDEISSDEEGTEFADVEEARIEATRALSDFCEELILSGIDFRMLSVTVRDDAGYALIFELNFRNLRPH
jgi:hypothetical protein